MELDSKEIERIVSKSSQNLKELFVEKFQALKGQMEEVKELQEQLFTSRNEHEKDIVSIGKDIESLEKEDKNLKSEIDKLSKDLKGQKKMFISGSIIGSVFGAVISGVIFLTKIFPK